MMKCRANSHLDPIKIVTQHDLCAGCGVCQGLTNDGRIEVKMSEAGYLRPLVNGIITKDEANILSQVCPGLNVKHFDEMMEFDDVWGPLKGLYISASSDNVVRSLGSSGGVLSALQIFLLESKEVDYIVGISQAKNDPCDVSLNICKTRDDVIWGIGSRYAPSAPLQRILKFLDAPGRFAFVGKPCDVAALRRYGQFDSRVKIKIPYILSFLCAGVPSKQGTLHIFEKLGVHREDVVSLKYRGDGWPGSVKVTLKNGSIHRMGYKESWGQILSNYIQWRCKICPDGTGEFADISCGDAWHISSDGSVDFSEHEGRSLVMIRTDVGRQLFQRCLENNILTNISVASIDYLNKCQFHQSYRRRTLLARYIALKLLGKGFPSYNYGILLNAVFKISPWRLIRSFVGTIRRSLTK